MMGYVPDGEDGLLQAGVPVLLVLEQHSVADDLMVRFCVAY